MATELRAKNETGGRKRVPTRKPNLRRLRRASRAAGRALNHSERQFEILVSGVQDYAIYMLDPKGIIASWNAGAQNIKGYTADEIIGQHYSMFYTDVDRKADRPQESLRIAAEQGRFETNAWRLRKDGSLFWANVVIAAIRDEEGYLLGFAKVTRDISDRRHNEERLHRLAQYDTLTGLANRYSFLTKLDKLI